MGRGCRYRFDPAEWTREHGHPSSVQTEWTCPRETVADEAHCPFHLAPDERAEYDIDSATLSRRLREELTDDDGPMRYIGATFESVDLSTTVIERATNAPIDFRHATVQGDFEAAEATVHQPVRLDHATIEGAMRVPNAQFSHAVHCANLSVAGRATFENATFGDTVDFSESHFRGFLTFNGTTFERDADFYRFEAAADCRFQHTEWEKECRFQMADIAGGVDFVSSTFHERTDFRSVTFGGVARFSKSRFEKEARFLDATFERPALFKKIEFASHAYFQQTRFDTEASFSETTFEAKTKFQFAEFHGEAPLSYVRFQGNVYFQHATFFDYASFFESVFEEIADFRWAEFHGLGRFMDAEFAIDAYFDMAVFRDVGDFRDAQFRASAIFRNATFSSPPMFQRAVIETIHVVDIETPADELTMDFEAGMIRQGLIEQTNGVETYYNFREATLGDIDISIDTTGWLFENILVSRTTFDGFDFSRYHYALSPKWDLHSFAGQTAADVDTEASRFQLGDREESDDITDTETTTDRDLETESEGFDVAALRRGVRALFSPDWSLTSLEQTIANSPTLETTYLKAKNGANEVGDSRAASAFFVREMYYRRYTHIKRLTASSEAVTTRGRAAVLAFFNLLLSISCGYGEKPYRTLLSSVGTVAAFSLVYALLLDAPPFGSVLGYALFSFQSFIALIIGANTDPFGFAATLVAVTQGFVGAFFIGLFVFTLTRSIHR